jgi:hypothetical protein
MDSRQCRALLAKQNLARIPHQVGLGTGCRSRSRVVGGDLYLLGSRLTYWLAFNGRCLVGQKDEAGEEYIRANQGHGIQVVQSEHFLQPLTSAENVPMCVHGTQPSVWDKILMPDGLNRMRNK